jgi:hypothetical protein
MLEELGMELTLQTAAEAAAIMVKIILQQLELFRQLALV